jgi:hypothetical protein
MTTPINSLVSTDSTSPLRFATRLLGNGVEILNRLIGVPVTMEKIPRLTESQRENLVAYLDGELEDEAARDIDEVLAKSPVARHEVQMLSQTIELVDTLDRPAASEEFTKKTLASLDRIDAKPAGAVAGGWLVKLARRTGVLAVWAVALVISTYAGFSLTNRWLPGEQDLLLDDLPIVESYHRYKRVKDAEFLRELQKQGTLKNAFRP